MSMVLDARCICVELDLHLFALSYLLFAAKTSNLK